MRTDSLQFELSSATLGMIHKQMFMTNLAGVTGLFLHIFTRFGVLRARSDDATVKICWWPFQQLFPLSSFFFA